MNGDQRKNMISLLMAKTAQGRISWSYHSSSAWDTPLRPRDLGTPIKGLVPLEENLRVYTSNVQSPSGKLSIQLREQPELLGGGPLLSIRNIETGSEVEIQAETKTLRNMLEELLEAVEEQRRKRAPDDIIKVLEDA